MQPNKEICENRLQEVQQNNRHDQVDKKKSCVPDWDLISHPFCTEEDLIRIMLRAFCDFKPHVRL